VNITKLREKALQSLWATCFKNEVLTSELMTGDEPHLECSINSIPKSSTLGQ